jgi:replicative DNA helicase
MNLPHSVAAEQALLGMLMLNNANLAVISDRITPRHFFVPIYAECYAKIQEIIGEGSEANPITLREKLRGGPFDDDGLLAQQLVPMFENAALGNNPWGVGKVIVELDFQRQVIALARDLAAKAEKNDVAAVQEAQKLLTDLHSGWLATPDVTPIDQMRDAFSLASSDGGMMPTGIRAWDETFGGLSHGGRYVVAGHGGVGKSAFAINIAWNMAKAGRKVRWLGFEDSIAQLWWRVMSRQLHIPITSFRKGLTEHQQSLVVKGQEQLEGKDFLVFYNTRTLAERISLCGPCDLVVVDGMTSYLAPPEYSKIDKAGYVNDQCKEIADKTGAAVLILSHINSDSAKSGASISGIYGGQAATFDPEGIVDLRWADANDTSPTRLIDMKVLKNRFGPSGMTQKLAFTGEYMSYADY